SRLSLDLDRLEFVGQGREQFVGPEDRRVQPVRELLWGGRPVGVQIAGQNMGQGGPGVGRREAG
ncbi:hypothetical protein ADL35_11410, partial [Streptomyces sp. NRRL WC-3753]